MGFITKIIGKIVGKNIEGKTGLSKTKLTAIIAVLIIAVEQISTAWGSPINIPNYVLELLAGMGLWSLRDGIDSKK